MFFTLINNYFFIVFKNFKVPFNIDNLLKNILNLHFKDQNSIIKLICEAKQLLALNFF